MAMMALDEMLLQYYSSIGDNGLGGSNLYNVIMVLANEDKDFGGNNLELSNLLRCCIFMVVVRMEGKLYICGD